MKKRIISGILVICCTVSLVGCGSGSDSKFGSKVEKKFFSGTDTETVITTETVSAENREKITEEVTEKSPSQYKDYGIGYDTIEEAAAADIALFESKNWNAFLDTVSDEEWKYMYESDPDLTAVLSEVGISSAEDLKVKAYEKAADTSTDFYTIEKIELDDINQWNYRTFDFYKGNGVLQEYPINIYINGEKYDENENGDEYHFYYYQGNDGKWYSFSGTYTIVRHLICLLTYWNETLSDENSAYWAGLNYQSLPEEDYEVVEPSLRPYLDGRVVVVANAGEPYRAVDGIQVDRLVELLNSKGNSPELLCPVSGYGWKPKGWAIAYDSEGNCITYITDGTTDNMVNPYDKYAHYGCPYVKFDWETIE